MQAVERTLRILSSVATIDGSTTLKDLSSTTGLSMSTVHRYVHELIDLGYIRSNPDKRLSLGPKAVSLGALALSRDAVSNRIDSALDELSRLTRATSFIGQLAGDDVICTSMKSGTTALSLTVKVGELIPIRHAASARALLAFESADVVERVWLATGSKLGDDYQELLNKLGQVRSGGYDTCDSELDDGVWAVAAPIFGRTVDKVVGSVAVAGPVSLFADSESKNSTIKQVVDAASGLSGVPVW